MRECRNCGLFNRTTKTCGTAGSTFHDPETGRKERLGCWCYLPAKNAMPTNCWLYNVTEGREGWPRELNDFPNEIAE